MNLTVILLHGTKGTPHSNWIPWLKKELEREGHRVLSPQFPTPENQSLSIWFTAFDAQIPFLTKDDILVGHSMGAGFILRLLERSGHPVQGAVLVAGFAGALGLPEYDQLNASFVQGPFDWPKIKANAGHLALFAGDNDPYVPFTETQRLEKMLAVKARIFKNGGHLNSESGYAEFPELRDEVLRVVESTA